MKDGIPIGQFLRIKRNCTKLANYRQESDDLYRRFCERGYLHRQLRKAKQKVARFDRKDLLIKKSPEVSTGGPGPVRVITQFGTQWKIVSDILNKH